MCIAYTRIGKSKVYCIDVLLLLGFFVWRVLWLRMMREVEGSVQGKEFCRCIDSYFCCLVAQSHPTVFLSIGFYISFCVCLLCCVDFCWRDICICVLLFHIVVCLGLGGRISIAILCYVWYVCDVTLYGHHERVFRACLLAFWGA